MNAIPFVDLAQQYKALKNEVQKAIVPIFKNGHFIGGAEVDLFEKEFALYLGAKYCVTVNSGTDALILGLRALSFEKGDEVLVPTNTFVATALGISENGYKPVFIDCDIDYGINLSDLKRKITKKTKAIILVHLYGRPDKIDEVKKIISETGQKIHLIEDACQAHGAEYKGKKVGTFGILSFFSFYPGKNLGAYGDGGAIITDDSALEKKCRLLHQYGQEKKYYHKILGVNSRLDTVQAAILLTKLKHLEMWNGQRRKAAVLYTNLLNKVLPDIIAPHEYEGRKSVYHLYVIRVKRRDELLAYLQTKGVQALIHYPFPLHLQECYKYLGGTQGDLPISESFAKEIISLPLFPEITKAQITYIVNTISTFYHEKN